MPYIKSGDGRREALQRGEPALSAGELNYQIFYNAKNSSLYGEDFRDLVKDFINQFLGEKPNYQRYNDMTGALIRCQKEIKRRLNKEIDLFDIMEDYDDEIANYENWKIAENGDVY
jgi:hypothetical protein